MSLEKIITKIRALIAHQKSAVTIDSLEEADAFACKIQELCEKYRLSIAELGEAEVERAVRFVDFEPVAHGLKNKKRREVWFTSLGYSVAKAHGCWVLSAACSNHQTFVGLAVDAETARDMMGILAVTALRMSVQARREAKRNSRSFSLRDYLAGFAAMIDYRYKQRQPKQEGGERALIRLVDAMIGKALEERGVRGTSKFSLKQRQTPSYIKGVRDGESVPLEHAYIKNTAPVERQALPAANFLSWNTASNDV